MSKIEWTDRTWNCVIGCSLVSAGCTNCYAMGVAHRGMSAEHRGLTVLRDHGKGPRWTGEVRFLPERLAEPLRWRKPRRVFVNSMSDLFHEGLAFEQIAAVFGVMASAQRHTFQVLTKRPERAAEFFRWYEGDSGAGASAYAAMHAALELDADVEPDDDPPWPLPNVWLGVSVEDQATADERIPVLLTLPAAVRWVSYEPALGPVAWEWMDKRFAMTGANLRLDWIVVGGESGPKARTFDIAWARSTVSACRAAGVPCFVKQLGANPLWSEPPPPQWTARKPDRKGGDPSEWPEDLRVREWPEVSRG